jgi:Ribbon-helix-helix protein, copG family
VTRHALRDSVLAVRAHRLVAAWPSQISGQAAKQIQLARFDCGNTNSNRYVVIADRWRTCAHSLAKVASFRPARCCSFWGPLAPSRLTLGARSPSLARPLRIRVTINILIVTMPTSIHIPKPLLTAVDRKARSLGISRNRLIVQALEREVDARGWSPGFFDELRVTDRGAAAELRESMIAVRASRRSKPPVKL